MVIDSSIIIAFLRATNKKQTDLFKLKEKGETLHISSVTTFELYNGAKDDSKRADLNTLLQPFVNLSFDENVAIEAASIYLELKKSNQLIEFRDIFIAATAIVHKLPISTLNRKHFERIKGLRLI